MSKKLNNIDLIHPRTAPACHARFATNGAVRRAAMKRDFNASGKFDSHKKPSSNAGAKKIAPRRTQ